MTAPVASTGLTLGFAVLGVGVAASLAWALRRAGARRAAWALLGWLALSGGLAASGALAHYGPAPRMVPVLALGLAGTLWLALSGAGARLLDAVPLWALIGFQVFRLPVELLLHQGALEGVVPWLMTWSGRNLDILAPLAAGPLAVLAAGDRLPRALAWAFAVGGLVLVVNVAAHGALAMPGPQQRLLMSPPNTWIAHWPFVWLPTVLVPAAIGGQLLLIRRLWASRAVSPARRARAPGW